MHRNPASLDIMSHVPAVVEWAEQHSHDILQQGRLLTDHEISLARMVGVEQPTRIRLKVMSHRHIPLPGGALGMVAGQLGLYPDRLAGLTLGYGVYLHESQLSDSLFLHEFTHVRQFERKGASIDQFMHAYLADLA